jgi:hypothetical protein
MPEGTTMNEDVGAAFLVEAKRCFASTRALAEGALAQLQDGEFFRSPGPEANSVAVLVQHLAGNMASRFSDFLTTDGEKPTRQRDREFEMPPSTSRTDLMKAWDAGWKILFDTLGGLSSADVLRSVTIRGEPHSVLQALSRQETHYAQHVGQIVYVAKLIRGSDWKSLSIPRGKSEEFNRRALDQRRHLA